MVKKILVNAQSMEETRVAVMSDKELLDYDLEISSKKPIKGNIYLAKVIRVEPSLQAVFIDYGDDRNGFLPFSEIHPDYYRIPADDMKREELAEAEDQAIEIAERKEAVSEVVADEALGPDPDGVDLFAYPESVFQATSVPAAMPSSKKASKKGGKRGHKKEAEAQEEGTQEVLPEGGGASAASSPESVLSPEDLRHREQKNKIRQRKTRYRVQEVIFPKQVLLVQAIKDKRGKKCAAFSTYISLAGQYCVLMPNAGERMGGVSKRIQEDDTRKRLKDVLKDLGVPDQMSMIIRTAGQERTKTEIKRDYEYLIRIWDDIRAKTLESNAPQLIYAEADLLVRVVRDFYQKDIAEIVVDTPEAYKQIRASMKKLSPSGVRKVKLYKEAAVSLFNAYDVEGQIVAMVSPRVELPSGGSLVIGQTEALVAIDVNSGRSTRERNLDTTALKTNLEAAKEIARQLRLRDLSGLIVIDFIDMAERKHIQQVEHAMQQELTLDRARVQIAPISQFGLMEMSRQRLRSSVMEVYSEICPHCQGRGRVYSVQYFVTTVLHYLEKTILSEHLTSIQLLTPEPIAAVLLNKHRRELFELEQKHDCTISVGVDQNLADTDFIIDKGQGTPVLFSLEKSDEDIITAPSDLLEAVKESGALDSGLPPDGPKKAMEVIVANKTERRKGGNKRGATEGRKGRGKSLGRDLTETELEETSEAVETWKEDETVVRLLSENLGGAEEFQPLAANGEGWKVQRVRKACRAPWRRSEAEVQVVSEEESQKQAESHEWADGEVRLLEPDFTATTSSGSGRAVKVLPMEVETLEKEVQGTECSELSILSQSSKRRSVKGCARQGISSSSKAERKVLSEERCGKNSVSSQDSLTSAVFEISSDRKGEHSEEYSAEKTEADPALGGEVPLSHQKNKALDPSGQQGFLAPQRPTDRARSKDQIIGPDLWKTLLKKKGRNEVSTSFEPASFTQAIKERLTGEDTLTSEKRKKGRQAWLSELLENWK